jgi:phosphatidylserine decarboxylase
VVGVRYRPGKFLNALKPASAQENERLELLLQETGPAGRPLIVRQIAGAIARRIVCWVRLDEELPTGAQFGMIKLGSRTELLVPREAGLEIVAKLGQKVAAGESILARYRSN